MAGAPGTTVEGRLGELERRVAVLERKAGLAAPPTDWVHIDPAPPPAAAAETPSAAPKVEPAPAPTLPATAAREVPPVAVPAGSAACSMAGPAIPPVVERSAEHSAAAASAHPPVAPVIARPPVVVALPRPAGVQKKAQATGDLETWFGTRWLAVGGALAVAAGVIFFLKYAVDQGWMTQVPAWSRCALGAAFGFVLLGVGEWARRRINALASAGISSAGVACLYASVYAAYGYAEIIGAGLAFVLLALSSGLGVFISSRSRLAIVAVVSLVGAYLAPFLLTPRDASPVVFPLYSLALLATGLVLSAWLRGGFKWVGRMVWWATLVVGGWWCVWKAKTDPWVVMAYLSAVWGGVHLSAIWQARGQVARETPDGRPAPLNLFGSTAVLSSFSVTGWAAVLAALALREGAHLAQWPAAAALLVACAMLGLVLAGHLRVLTDAPTTDRERLGSGLILQSAGLLVATVALMTAGSGAAAVVVWLMMGLAAIGAGRWMNARSLDIYGVVLLSIGTLRLALWDSWASKLFSAPVAFYGLQFSTWTVFAVAAGAAWLVGAGLLLIHRQRNWASVVCATVGVVCLCAALAHPDAAPVSMIAAWLGIALVAVVCGRLSPRLGLRWSALGVSTLATWWLLLLGVAGRGASVGWEIGGLAITAQWGAMMWAALVWGVQAYGFTRRLDDEPWGKAMAVLCAVAGLACAGLAPMGQGCSAAVWMWTWLCTGAGASVLARFERRLGLATSAVVLLMLSCAAWVGAFVVREGAWEKSPAMFLLHPGLVSAVALAVALLACRRWCLTEGSERAWAGRTVTAIVAIGMLWAGTSFEFARTVERLVADTTFRAASVSVWWGLFATGMIVVGFRRRLAAVRHVGLLLLAGAAVKMVIIDLAHVPTPARIASFVTLGLLMLAVAAGYARAGQALKGATPPSGG